MTDWGGGARDWDGGKGRNRFGEQIGNGNERMSIGNLGGSPTSLSVGMRVQALGARFRGGT
eukprot:3741960-Pyramimonas_sp.AAC.1